MEHSFKFTFCPRVASYRLLSWEILTSFHRSPERILAQVHAMDSRETSPSNRLM